VLLKFQYICTQEDRNEMRVWLFNHELFMLTPKFYDKNSLFVDLDRFLEFLKKEVEFLYPLRKKDEEDKVILNLDDMWT